MAKRYVPQTSLTAPQMPVPKEFAAKIDRLDINTATRKDVIEQLGKPQSYVLGDQPLDANNLPDNYAMVYPSGVQVMIEKDHIRRIPIFAPGYLFRGKIQVGSTLEEVFEVLGPPAKTIEGAKGLDASKPQEDNVFYRDLGGIKDNALYRTQGAAIWLSDNHVRGLILVPRK